MTLKQQIATYKSAFYGEDAKGEILYVPNLNEWFASSKIGEVDNKVTITGHEQIFDVGHFDDAEIPARLKAAFAATGVAQNAFEISVDRANNKIEYDFQSGADATAALKFLQSLQTYVKTKPKVALVVTGSVAAIKTGLLANNLKAQGFEVAYQITPTGKTFLNSGKYPIPPHQLQEMTAKTDASGAKITLVAPATANYIGLLAHGLVKHEGHLIIAPAMNFMMWQHPATQANVAQLRAQGVKFLGPVLGGMACRDYGYGRMAEVADIAAAVKDENHPLHKLIDNAVFRNPKAPNAIRPNLKKILLVSHTNETDHDLRKELEAKGYEVTCVTAKNKHYDSNTTPPGMEHIRLPEAADLVIMHNTTPEILQGMEQGRGGNFINDLYLASKAPTIIISQNPQPKLEEYGTITITNITQLEGVINMATQDLAGKHYLILGGTPRERVDSFRFYANNKRDEDHGAKVAAELRARGANVTFICPAHSKSKPDGAITSIQGKKIESAADMIAAANELQAGFDGVLQLANISQVKCPNPVGHKISKTSAEAPNLFETVGNIDVIAALQKFGAVTGYNNYQEVVGDSSLFIQHDPKTQKQDTAVPTLYTEQIAARKNRVVITTSRTEEPLTADGVIITNSFSGKQGQAIARAFLAKGWEVVLITGPTNLPDVDGVRNIHVTSMAEMLEAAKRETLVQTDAYISAAAIADFSVKTPLNIRLKDGEARTLVMQENASVVGTITKGNKRPAVVVSFAAQSPETILEYATSKFAKLGVDLTVANPIGADTPAARDSDKNRIYFVTASGAEGPIETSKAEVGHLLTGKVEELLAQKRQAEKG